MSDINETDSERMKRLRGKAMRLPLDPGVYIMKNKQDKIIYIGKAKHLKNRVSQYFGSQNGHNTKVRKMVENVNDFDYIVVGSEFEALVLECSLIKQHTPKYNILLKDDKGYSYLCVSGDKWKRLSVVNQKDDKNAQYIGPYMSKDALNKAFDEACKIFMLPTCSLVFPRDLRHCRPCLNYYIKQCDAPCRGNISAEQNNKKVDEAIRFITQGSDTVIKELTLQMNEAAESLEFEKAASLRDTINAIKKMNEKQVMYSNSTKEVDVFAMSESTGKICMSVLRFSDGRLYDSEWFIENCIDDLNSVRGRLIVNFYTMREKIPPNIVVDGILDDEDDVKQFLCEKRGKNVKIIHPERGELFELMNRARANSAEKLAQRIGRQGKDVAALQELQDILGLPKIPEYIESYDISHTAGQQNVAGMIVFRSGRSLKSAYRRFEIKSANGGDDYKSMEEVLTRRFVEYFKLKDTEPDEGFGKKPDLILLDGGLGQVNVVKKVLDSFGLGDIALFGMVKDGKHRTRAIQSTGGEISITDKRRAFVLVASIQEEVHRFSVEYHRKKQSKEMVHRTLTEIDGIGEQRAKKMLKHFGSIGKIKKASVEQIAEVDGISEEIARKVYKFYHEEENDEGKT